MESHMPKSGSWYYAVSVEILIEYYIVHFFMLLAFCITLVVEMIYNRRFSKNIVPMFYKKINKKKNNNQFP